MIVVITGRQGLCYVCAVSFMYRYLFVLLWAALLQTPAVPVQAQLVRTGWSDTSLDRQRLLLLNRMDSSRWYGLEKSAYPVTMWRRQPGKVLESSFAEALFSFCRGLYEGEGISKRLGYDAFSASASTASREYLLRIIDAMQRGEDADSLLRLLEPGNERYALLKAALAQALARGDESKATQLAISLNFYRWMHHFGMPRYVVVNLAAARLIFVEEDSVRLEMNVVAGKPATPTPRFAAECGDIILYPYWNVPRSIAVNEMLPLIRKAPAAVNALNLQVIDQSGKVVDYRKLPWKQFTKNYFPYRLRQATGCDNALGVIKFNLNSPYSVYLHDTNFKGAFSLPSRYYSHGCIRVQKPVALARCLLQHDLDTALLSACVRNQTPETLKLQRPVPVFVVYLPADVDSGRVLHHPDVYRLMPRP